MIDQRNEQIFRNKYENSIKFKQEMNKIKEQNSKIKTNITKLEVI